MPFYKENSKLINNLDGKTEEKKHLGLVFPHM